MEKEVMIERMGTILTKLYYEDVEFFLCMAEKYARKKGVELK